MPLTAEQQKVRATRIGGSEIAAVAGLNPWESPLDIWLRKTGRADPKVETFHMTRGKHLGPGLVRWFSERTQMPVSFYGDNELTIPSQKYRLVCATPDALVADDGVLETKMPSWRTAHHWGEDGTDQVPDYYIPQGIWEMAATERTSCWFAAPIEDDLCVYRIGWDQEIFEHLNAAAERFWRDHVEKDVAPPVDGSSAAADWLARRFPTHRAPLIESDAQLDAWARELRSVKKLQRDLEATETLLQNRIKERLGESEGVKGSWGTIYWRQGKAIVRTDWHALALSMCPSPSQLAAFTVAIQGNRSFRPYFSKKDE
jgi:putative phage-type endonuclease